MHEVNTNKLIIVAMLAGIGLWTLFSAASTTLADVMSYNAQDAFITAQTGFNADGTPAAKKHRQ